MAFLKYLGWAAGGVAAVVAAPLTGGGSIALLLGAAGTTTVGGALLGAASGAAIGAMAESASEKKTRLDAGRREAEFNKAGWAKSEAMRREQAELHEGQMKVLKERIAAKFAQDENMLKSLSVPMADEEAEILFAMAAAIAHIDGAVSPEERDAAVTAVSLLCKTPDQAIATGQLHFESPMTETEMQTKLNSCQDEWQLQRIGFILNVVADADDQISINEQRILGLFHAHCESVKKIKANAPILISSS